jgi:serine/threonine-protein kinase RsbW
LPEVVELEVPARADYLAIVRLVVNGVARLHPEYDDDQIDDLRLAVSEACTNAIEAHAAVPTDSLVLVQCLGSDERFEVCILDRGGGFDLTDLRPHPPVTDPSRLKFERGLGIPLIKALVDEAHFEANDHGTVVRLAVLPSPVPSD